MARSKRPTRAQSYCVGEKGVNRVRLFPDDRTGLLELEFYDEARRRKRLALGHYDFSKGKEAAESLAAALRRNDGPRSTELTLGELFDRYERAVTHKKRPSAQAHDRRARALFEACWGASSKVKDLGREEWDAFIDRRRSGQLRPAGGYRKVVGVRNRVIEQDLRFLMAVCNWAITVKDCGRRLLDANPFRKLPVPCEKSPRRPLTTEDEFARIRQAASDIGGMLPLYVVLVHETGHRCNAVAKLRWSDVSLEKGTLLIRGEIDKQGVEHVVPLSDTALGCLRDERRRRAQLGDGWLFPSPTDQGRSISRNLVRDWWQRLESGAGLERVPGRGWHSLRRKFATDLDKSGARLADIAHLGGWKGTQTLLQCYIHPDRETMRHALQKRAELRTASA